MGIRHARADVVESLTRYMDVMDPPAEERGSRQLEGVWK